MPITDVQVVILQHLVAALAAGGLVGLERSYHGRPAGFRTHALVCIASALLMLLAVYQGEWLPTADAETFRTDPTRMAQGIMTGIGFLGAGVIFKEGLSVRGLTTAASIWITAAIGILIGVGFYFPAVVATTLVLGTLSVFRWIEDRMPTQFYAHHVVRFPREAALDESALRRLLQDVGFSIANMSYRLTADGRIFEYSMVIRTFDLNNLKTLADRLRSQPSVIEFRISPTGD
jgi:putative Mg2+ transporter-C (MgtC) family protein